MTSQARHSKAAWTKAPAAAASLYCSADKVITACTRAGCASPWCSGSHNPTVTVGGRGRKQSGNITPAVSGCPRRGKRWSEGLGQGALSCAQRALCGRGWVGSRPHSDAQPLYQRLRQRD